MIIWLWLDMQNQFSEMLQLVDVETINSTDSFAEFLVEESSNIK